MYRILMGKTGTTDATYKASVAMKKGELVVKATDGTVGYPSAATDKNVFFVGKEVYSTGANGDREVPDYDSTMENIAASEGVTVEKPVVGNEYFTTRATGTFSVGGYAVVGTAGMLVPTATSGKFIIKETAYTDCGNTGVVFEVLD